MNAVFNYLFIGHCQPDVQVVSFFILPPEYQAGMRYYLYSTHGNKNTHTHKPHFGEQNLTKDHGLYITWYFMKNG